MTLDDMKYVAKMYGDKLSKEIEVGKNYSSPTTTHESQKYLVEMSDKIQDMNMIEYGKANRYLGFMQGVLWEMNYYSLDEIKKHNRYGVRKPLLDEDGKLKQSILIVGGKSFYCDNEIPAQYGAEDGRTHDCGCNIFHHPDEEDLKRYKCNSCGAEYVGDENDG